MSRERRRVGMNGLSGKKSAIANWFDCEFRMQTCLVEMRQMSSEDEFEEFANREGPFSTDTHALIFLFLQNFAFEESRFKYLFHTLEIDTSMPDLWTSTRRVWKRLKKSCFDSQEKPSKLLLQVTQFVSKFEQDLAAEREWYETDCEKVCRSIKTDLFDLLHHPLLLK